MPDLELLARRGCATVVASVAAYASYEHQRIFALDGGADPAGASLWPLSVDGLLVLATIGLLKPPGRTDRRTRYAVRLAFVFGIAVSLAANVAAAPHLAWQPVLVAGWPPVALLLAVELLAHNVGRREPRESSQASEPVAAPRRSRPAGERESPASEKAGRDDRDATRGSENLGSESPSTSRNVSSRGRGNAEEMMWDYFRGQREQGRTPTGAELDRVAGTNNYGRAVLAKWRRSGRAAPLPASEAEARQEPAHADGSP